MTKHNSPAKRDKKIKLDNKDGQISNSEKEIKELKMGWQRTQADFENFRKKTENEKYENLMFAKAEFMTKLTPVLDNFRRAFEHAPDQEKDVEWVNGVKQIEKQLEDILFQEGLEKIPANTGDKFDPNFHEAISCEENKDIAADCIIAEIESGWMFQGKVLKVAKVRVSRGK